MMEQYMRHAIRWSGTDGTDLGCYLGKDSGGTAINSSGLVAGWVCIHPEDRGQENFRPAAWLPGEDVMVLTEFGCDWGEAVGINDGGTVLLRGFVGFAVKALLWRPESGDYEIIGGNAVQGVHPVGLTNDEVVLGFGHDRNNDIVAVLASPAGGWEPLGTPPSWYPTAINDGGVVVGTAIVNGYERPWLRRYSGEVVWLPYFDYHHCRPSAINRNGVVVGQATADHGTHALMWRSP
jgi:hypothetical protein